MNTDSPRAVRAGEELDLARLADWMRSSGLSVEELSQEQFPRGHSNLTYLLRSGAQEFVLRRPPFGSKVKTAHDMAREARIMMKLHPAFPLAPRVVALCEDEAVLGAPFYLMERMRGIILRGTVAMLPPAQARELCGTFVRTLAALHAVDWRAAGLEGKPEGYVRRQVEGWTKRWQDARTAEVPEMEKIASWLAARIPAELSAAFIHNDFKYDNLVLDDADPTRAVGVLDWEMATVGDPLMDLGTALGYWVEDGDSDELKLMAFGPTFMPGSMSRAELAAEYFRLARREPTDMLFYYCFALFKIAVIVQQIYKRFVQGLTKDERFAMLGMAVQVLAQRALQAAESGKI